MGSRAGLDGCGKSRPYRDSIPGPSIPQPVAIPTCRQYVSSYTAELALCLSHKPILEVTGGRTLGEPRHGRAEIPPLILHSGGHLTPGERSPPTGTY